MSDFIQQHTIEDSSIVTSILSSNNSDSNCSIELTYSKVESLCYLYIMCPLAFLGVVLNIVSLRVFADKGFNSVTFKYLRLITWTDLFICIMVIPYCTLLYTQPFNAYDAFIRRLYMAYIFNAGANFAINLSMILNLLVTVERLISVAMPTKKYLLFKPSRYYLSVFIAIVISIVFNVSNVFVYKVSFCKDYEIREFANENWWMTYGYIKEVINLLFFLIHFEIVFNFFLKKHFKFCTRILPIVLLIIANIILISVVNMSRKRMRKRTTKGLSGSKSSLVDVKKNTINNNTSNTKRILNCFSKCKTRTNENDENELGYNRQEKISLTNIDNNNVTSNLLIKTELANKRPSNFNQQPTTATTATTAATKRNRNDSQLTHMIICVAFFYCISSIPMVVAYPGILFSTAEIHKTFYKIYSSISNILELMQCSLRFLIYFCFTTQFRSVFYQLYGRKTDEPTKVNNNNINKKIGKPV
jgi:hypothetical protein